jgi:acyl-CoA dehydrogenase
MGWLAMLIPEEHGGLGLSLADAVTVLTVLGGGVVPGPYHATILAAEAIRLAGSTAQRARLLPSIAAGRSVATVAGTRLDNLAITADRRGRLTGACGAVAFAALADVIVVPVLNGDAVDLWQVDPRDGDVTVTPCQSVDATSRVGFVTLAAASGERLDGAPDAWPRFVRHGAVLTAADLLGMAERALALTVEYVRLREQFGRPIGANQGVKHPLVDVYVANTMARKGLFHAADALGREDRDAFVAASVAKAKCNDAARDATAAMIQFHGAIGFTWPHPAHLFFKRAKRQEYEFGDTIWHRERVADHWIKETSPE